MIILNLKAINNYRCFQNLMLNLFNNDIFAIDEEKNVTGTEMDCIYPTLDRGIERVSRCCDDLFFGNFVPCPDRITGLDRVKGEPWNPQIPWLPSFKISRVQILATSACLLADG